MTIEAAEKVAKVMLEQNRSQPLFDVNFTDVDTCRSMAEAFRSLGCEAELVDEGWCLVRVRVPGKVELI
jgi:hypothetical protein